MRRLYVLHDADGNVREIIEQRAAKPAARSLVEVDATLHRRLLTRPEEIVVLKGRARVRGDRSEEER